VCLELLVQIDIHACGGSKSGHINWNMDKAVEGVREGWKSVNVCFS